MLLALGVEDPVLKEDPVLEAVRPVPEPVAVPDALGVGELVPLPLPEDVPD